jgi:hypothetical protein
MFASSAHLHRRIAVALLAALCCSPPAHAQREPLEVYSLDGDTALRLARDNSYGLNLCKLQSLTPSAARALVSGLQGKGAYLLLDGIHSLDSSTAAQLAPHNGRLTLNGLTAVDEECAQHLAQARGILELNGIRTLPAETVHTLAAHDGPLCLGSLDISSMDLAEAISKHRGELLVAAIPTNQNSARALAAHEGDLAFVNGLTTVSPRIVALFSQHRGPVIFQGDGVLTTETASALAGFEAPVVLPDAADLSLEAQNALANASGVIVLPSLRSILSTALSRKLVRLPEKNALAPQRLQRLDFTRVEQMTAEVAEVIAAAKADVLRVGHPEKLGNEITEILCKFRGSLELWGNESHPLRVSPDIARLLLGHRGDITLWNCEDISLEAQDILARHKYVLDINGWRPGLKRLDSVTLAQKLINQPNRDHKSLVLSVHDITEPVARVLARHRGYLSLGLTSLPPNVANALAAHVGNGDALNNNMLSLDDLEDLDEEAAKHLLRHTGTVRLSKLRIVTAETKAILLSPQGRAKFQAKALLAE